jgi:hypothetical protein
MKLYLLIATLLLASTASAQDGFTVIVQKDNAAASVTKAQLRKMMMGEGSWQGGGKVVVALGPVGDSARTAALKDICGMSEADFAKHILRVKFEGASKSVPKTYASGAAVRQFVQATVGALGIVQAGELADTVKALPVE